MGSSTRICLHASSGTIQPTQRSRKVSFEAQVPYARIVHTDAEGTTALVHDHVVHPFMVQRGDRVDAKLAEATSGFDSCRCTTSLVASHAALC